MYTFSPLATEQGGCARSDSTHHLVDFALLGVADLIPLRMAVAEGAAEVVVVDVVEGGQVAPHAVGDLADWLSGELMAAGGGRGLQVPAAQSGGRGPRGRCLVVVA